MTTSTLTHEQRCRYLAELTVGGIPDSRFQALRGEHAWIDFSDEGGDIYCFHEDDDDDDGHKHGTYCPRTDAGALLEAAAACGYRVEINGHQVRLLAMDQYGSPIEETRVTAPTPAEALSATLVAAVNGGRA